MNALEFTILSNKNWREILSNAPYNLKISENDKYIYY